MAPVHPRWRGEQSKAKPPAQTGGGSSPLARGTAAKCSNPAKSLGSSPLARGTVVGQQLALQLRRFIPAGAGNRRVSGGEIMRPVGSSPLARGTAEVAPDRCDLLRFIPAGAGNSALHRWHPAWIPVHPRWRGEQLILKEHKEGIDGSSPLARGTVQRPYVLVKFFRTPR